MNDPLLVTYASKYGATQEVAEAIATALSERGLNVNLLPVRQVRSLGEYGPVVLGAPLYIGRWPGEVGQFLARFQPELARRQVAVFTLGPTQAGDKDWQGARDQLDQELARYPWLKPVKVELLGGKYDPARLRFPDSLLAKLPASPLYQLPPSDQRDWTAIRAWADDVYAGLAT
ncbi:MAG: flavodoxin domain-containing protein [Anaerolineaceae bacterium]|nr:flavodoxin domain-containing protein [Anaerolineaceae bacterium]